MGLEEPMVGPGQAVLPGQADRAGDAPQGDQPPQPDRGVHLEEPLAPEVGRPRSPAERRLIQPPEHNS